MHLVGIECRVTVVVMRFEVTFVRYLKVINIVLYYIACSQAHAAVHRHQVVIVKSRVCYECYNICHLTFSEHSLNTYTSQFANIHYDNGILGTLEFRSIMGIATMCFLLFLFKALFRPTKKALKKDKFAEFKLIGKKNISHDTIRITFANPLGKDAILGLPIGQHITFKFTDDEGKEVLRSYTPVTGDERPGDVTFVIKVYKKGVHPKFPDGGKMSQYVDSLKVRKRQGHGDVSDDAFAGLTLTAPKPSTGGG